MRGLGMATGAGAVVSDQNHENSIWMIDMRRLNLIRAAGRGEEARDRFASASKAAIGLELRRSFQCEL